VHRGFPIATPGLRVGLLGGSFDPPHGGHVHITRWALKAFALDQVWWLVSPANPLKRSGPAPMGRRIAACLDLVQHPRVKVTNLETRLGTRYTAHTLEKLIAHYPGVRFVWLMGADNLADIHRWKHWRRIMDTVPVGVLARPGGQLAAGCSCAARVYREHRLSARSATALPFRAAPCWSLLTGPMMDVSSSQIRAAGRWSG